MSDTTKTLKKKAKKQVPKKLSEPKQPKPSLPEVLSNRPWRMSLTICFTSLSRKVWPDHLRELRRHLEGEAQRWLAVRGYDVGSAVSEGDYSYVWRT